MIELGSNKNDVIYEQPLTYKVTIMTMTGKKGKKGLDMSYIIDMINPLQTVESVAAEDKGLI